MLDDVHDHGYGDDHDDDDNGIVVRPCQKLRTISLNLSVPPPDTYREILEQGTPRDGPHCAVHCAGQPKVRPDSELPPR